MVRFFGISRLLAALATLFCTKVARADTGKMYLVEHPSSLAEGGLRVPVSYSLWIPPNVRVLRGLIVHQHGAGIIASNSGATGAYDLHWQALAKKWDCALLCPSYHVLNEATDTSAGGSEWWFDPRRGSDQAFLTALQELADQSGHSELTGVPWVLWGTFRRRSMGRNDGGPPPHPRSRGLASFGFGRHVPNARFVCAPDAP